SLLSTLPSCLYFFFFYCYAHHRDLHSFPTRRSSDLQHRGLHDAAAHGLIPSDAAAALAVVGTPAHGGRSVPSVGRDRRAAGVPTDRKSTRLNSSHVAISYAVFCLKKKKKKKKNNRIP